MKARALLLFFTLIVLLALAVPLIALANGGSPRHGIATARLLTCGPPFAGLRSGEHRATAKSASVCCTRKISLLFIESDRAVQLGPTVSRSARED